MNRSRGICAWLFAAVLALAIAPTSAGAQSAPRISHRVVGLHEAYVVQKGDTLQSLSARHGIPARILARDNGLKPGTRLKAGTTLRIDDRHIVPADLDDGIVINIPQLMLFFFQRGEFKAA